MAQKQPNPITEGWGAYRKLVDEELKKNKKKRRNACNDNTPSCEMLNT